LLHGFTGHEDDADLGLVNMRSRIYDPRVGRFLSADPFVSGPLRSQAWNRYSYVNNNPLTLVDPTGFYCPQDPGADLTMCIYGSGRVEYAPFAIPFQSMSYDPSNNYG